MATHSSKRRLPPPIVFLLLGFVLFTTISRSVQFSQSWSFSNISSVFSSPPSAQSFPLSHRMSLGEQLLVPLITTSDKRDAIQAFAEGDYSTALQKFQRSLDQQPNDPESLIYKNNAQIGRSPALKVAVSVPIGSNPNVAQEMLRGVAQAQNEINQSGGIHGKGLQVQIADDDNDPEIAKQIADILVNDPNILAVIGHNASNASVAAAPIYQQAGLVMITPTSFANLLSNFGSYIFRTAPTIRSMAAPLAEYGVRQEKLKNIAICYDSLAPDNVSFRDEFAVALFRLGGRQTDLICDFASPTFNPEMVMSQIQKSQAEGILLAPHIDRIDPAIALAQTNQNRLPLLGSTTLYTFQTLQQGGQDLNGLVLPVPWFPTEPFASKARRLWGGNVNWRTASAYDATKAIIAGLQQNITRRGLQQVLRHANFATVGASEKVQFLTTGDRISQAILVKVVADSRNSRFARLQR